MPEAASADGPQVAVLRWTIAFMPLARSAGAAFAELLLLRWDGALSKTEKGQPGEDRIQRRAARRRYSSCRGDVIERVTMR